MQAWLIDRLPERWAQLHPASRVALFCLGVAGVLAIGDLWYVAGLVAVISVLAFLFRAMLPR